MAEMHNNEMGGQQGGKAMIEELEHPYIDLNNGSGYMYVLDTVIEKINEIIRYLNEKENNDGNSTIHP